MLDGISGHSRWLNPPDEERHRKDCPQHEDNYEEGNECLCMELADNEYQDMIDRKLDEEKMEKESK